jgi:lipoyl-dependent peroxiredoxin
VTERTSTAEWRGDLKSGAGTLALGSGAFAGEYTFVSRFEEGEGTNPEELIAAAHAACFSMALSNMLATAGTPATSVATSATVTLGKIDGAGAVTKIVLSTVGTVPGIDEATFRETAEKAKVGCPISKLLAGGTADIELEVTFQEG